MRAFRVTIAEPDEDAATTALWEAGTAGVEVRRSGGRELELIAYFPAGTPLEDLRGLPLSARVEPAPIAEVDWLARFREGFRPFHAGRFLIVPAWEAEHPGLASPDRLIVDPGRAFGTGTHETTRLCLRALEQLSGRRRLGRTLDLGAGSGLLAIAACRLGAGPVVASDLDPEAIDSARRHAALNAVRLLGVRADGGRGFRGGRFDLVLANLMALLLVDRAAEIRSLLAPGGALVLSGLLLDDVPPVRDAFAACGKPHELQDGEWAALVFETAQ